MNTLGQVEPSLVLVNGVQAFSRTATKVLLGLFRKTACVEVTLAGGDPAYKLVPLAAGGESASDFLARSIPPNAVVLVTASAVPDGTETSDALVTKVGTEGYDVYFVIYDPGTDMSAVTGGNAWAVFLPPPSYVANDAEFRRIDNVWGYYCKPGFVQVGDLTNPDVTVCKPATAASAAPTTAATSSNTGLLVFGALAVAGIVAALLASKPAATAPRFR